MPPTTINTTTNVLAEIENTKKANSAQQVNETTTTTTTTTITSSSGQNSDVCDTSSQQVRALQQLVIVADLSTGTSSNCNQTSVTTTTPITTEAIVEGRYSDTSSKLLASIIDAVDEHGGGNSFVLTTVIANKYNNNNNNNQDQQQQEINKTTITTINSSWECGEMVVSKANHESDEPTVEEEHLRVPSGIELDESVESTIDEMKYEMRSNLANNLSAHKTNDLRLTASAMPLAIIPQSTQTLPAAAATTTTTMQRSQSLEARGVNLDSLLPERTRLRRQRRNLSQSLQDQPEDPVERLNRLRARISGALSQVKGVLRQYSVDGETEITSTTNDTDTKKEIVPQQLQAKENNADTETDAGPVQFRFVRKVRRRSVFNEADEYEEEKKKQQKMQTQKPFKNDSSDTANKVNELTEREKEVEKTIERQKQKDSDKKFQGDTNGKVIDTTENKAKQAIEIEAKNSIEKEFKREAKREVKLETVKNEDKNITETAGEREVQKDSDIKDRDETEQELMKATEEKEKMEAQEGIQNKDEKEIENKGKQAESLSKDQRLKKRIVVVTKSKGTGNTSRRASIAAVERSKIEPPIKLPVAQDIKAQRRPSDSEAILKKKVVASSKVTCGETKLSRIVHKVKQAKVNEIATTMTIGSEADNKNNNEKENNHIVMRDDENSNKDAALIAAATNDDAARTLTKIDEQSSASKVAQLISPLQDSETSSQLETQPQKSIESIEQTIGVESEPAESLAAITTIATSAEAPTEKNISKDIDELPADHSIAEPLDAVTSITTTPAIMPEFQVLPAPVQVFASEIRQPEPPFNVPKDEFAKKRVVLKKILRKNSNDKTLSTKKAPSIAISEPVKENSLPELEPESTQALELEPEPESEPVPLEKPRKVKKKVIIKRQQRRLSISDTGFFREPADTSENANPADDVETLERAISYVTDDDNDDDDDDSENHIKKHQDQSNKETEEETKAEELQSIPLKTCLKLREFEVGDYVMYAERYKKTLVRWKKGLVIERITSISYKLDIDGKEVPAHISYIKKYTDRKVNFGGKEYLEINYEQIEEEEKAARTYSIWNMV